MRVTRISEVEVDAQGRLLLHIDGEHLDYIYRAGMGVSWDDTLKSLVAPAPGEWSRFDWYRQIVAAVRIEYSQQLVVGPETVWKAIPADLRQAIEEESDTFPR